MSVSGVENSGRIYSEQVKNRQSEEEVRASEEQNHRVREDESAQEQTRASEKGIGESMDVTA